MKKTSGMLFTLLLSAYPVVAQNPRSDFSESFEEKKYRIVQTGSGSTIIAAATNDDGIMIRVYGKDHKLLAAPMYNDAKTSGITQNTLNNVALISNNNDAVFFIEYRADNRRKLHRYIISGKDGKLLSDEDIAETALDRPYLHYGYGFTKTAELPHFKVVKNGTMNDYSVIIFEGSDGTDAHTPIRIVQYDGSTQKEKARGGYDFEGPADRYVKLYDAVADRTGNVFMCVGAGDGATTNTNGVGLGLGVLENGQLKQYPLRLPGGSALYALRMAYNPVTDKLLILAATTKRVDGRKEIYNLQLLTLNPHTMAPASAKVLNHHLIDVYRKRHFDADKPFGGLLQEACIRPDGTLTILSRDALHVIPGGPALYDIGLLDVDTAGNALTGYSVPAPELPGLFGPWYVAGSSARYVVYNAHPGDFGRELSKDPKMSPALSDANAAAFYLKNDTVDRRYLLGEPDESFSSRALMANADYNLQTGEWPVIILDRLKARDKSERVAWVHLE